MTPAWIHLITVSSLLKLPLLSLVAKLELTRRDFICPRESKCFLCSSKVKPEMLSACQFVLLPQFTYSVMTAHDLSQTPFSEKLKPFPKYNENLTLFIWQNHKGSQWLFQQDNDKFHSTCGSTAWLPRNRVHLSPTENLCRIMMRGIRRWQRQTLNSDFWSILQDWMCKTLSYRTQTLNLLINFSKITKLVIKNTSLYFVR